MTRRTRRRSATFFAAFISVAMVAAACTPPPPPTVKTWEFKSTQVTVDEANDCVPVPFLGGCVPPSSETDEAYVLNLAFRVKIGQTNSAQTWVASRRSVWATMRSAEGFYVGIGAKGGLATTLDNALATFTVPDLTIPLLDLPPDIQEVGVFAMQNTKSFTGQNFDNSCLIPQCGEHTYNFQANQG